MAYFCSILSHRGYEKAEASTCSVVGRVVLASLCSLKIVYRWCVVSEDKEQETLTLYNMDTNLNAADAFLSDRMASDSEARLLTRCGNEEVPLVTHSTITDCSGTALSSRKHGTRGSTAEVTVENLGINPSLYTLSNHATACDSHYYRDHERNKNERSTTYDPNHDFTGAELDVPVGFFDNLDDDLEAVAENNKVILPYLYYKGVAKVRHADNEHYDIVFFDSDDTFPVHSEWVHTYVAERSPNKTTSDTRSFVALSDTRALIPSTNRFLEDDGDTPDEAVARKARKRAPATRSVITVNSEFLASQHDGWLSKEHLEQDDLTHPLHDKATCEVCGERNGELKWCSGTNPVGLGPLFACHRGVICDKCVELPKIYDRVCFFLGITDDLCVVTSRWMATMMARETTSKRFLWQRSIDILESARRMVGRRHAQQIGLTTVCPLMLAHLTTSIKR